MPRATEVLVLAAALAAAGCGGGGGPAAPSVAPSPVATQPSPAPSPTPSPEPSASPMPAPSPPPSAPVVLRTAALRGVNGHAASGTARIVREGGAFRLELLDDFRIDTTSIDVYLARQADTVTSADLNLGDLRATRGAQSYRLPDDGSAFSHVVLWCRPFRIPIGAGTLR